MSEQPQPSSFERILRDLARDVRVAEREPMNCGHPRACINTANDREQTRYCTACADASEQPEDLTSVQIGNRLLELGALACDRVAEDGHGDRSWRNAARACAEDVRKLKKQEDSDDPTTGDGRR